MQNGWLLIMLFSIGVLSSCTKTGDIDLSFRAVYDGDPLVMNTTLDYAFGEKIQMSRSDFFISDVELVDSDGNRVSLTNVALIELTTTHQSSTDAEEGYILSFSDIPEANYTSLDFGIGVQPSLNSMKPGDFDLEHPLGSSSFFWPGWNSYIFSKTEGRIDTLGGENFDLNFLYHSGSDDLYREVSFPINLEITADGSNEIVLEVDHKLIFFRDGEGLDIKKEPLSHSPGQALDYPTYIMDNFPSAISVK